MAYSTHGWVAFQDYLFLLSINFFYFVSCQFSLVFPLILFYFWFSHYLASHMHRFGKSISLVGLGWNKQPLLSSFDPINHGNNLLTIPFPTPAFVPSTLSPIQLKYLFCYCLSISIFIEHEPKIGNYFSLTMLLRPRSLNNKMDIQSKWTSTTSLLIQFREVKPTNICCF